MSQGGMGLAPLSWQEIRAWRLEQTLSLENFEINAIRQLSVDYVSEYGAASEEADRPAPYQDSNADEFDRESAGSRMKAFLRGRAKKPSNEDRYTIIEE